MAAANLEMNSFQDVNAQRKRILVLISEGGGGHKIASESMKEILSPIYDVDVVSVLPEIIYPLDYFTMLTSGSFTGDDFYNFLLRKGYHRAVSILSKMGLRYMFANRSRIEKLFQSYLQKGKNKYDLVISTFPFVNCGLALGAQKQNVPFLIMPTDLDTATFFFGLSKVDFSKGGKFAFAIPYDDQDLKSKALRSFKLPAENTFITGFPVRPDCAKRYTPEQLHLLKAKHGISPESLALTLILGAAGNEMLLAYTQELYKLNPEHFPEPIEINICLGRYEKMGQKIVSWLIEQGGVVRKETPAYTSILTSQGIVFHIRKYTREIIEIMASSKLIITKTGSCSVNEGIYLGKKLLLDNTEKSSARHIQWESFNVPFVRKHGLGDAFSDLNELNSMIRVLLQEDLGHPVLSGAFPVPDFKENIIDLVYELMEAKE